MDTQPRHLVFSSSQGVSRETIRRRICPTNDQLTLPPDLISTHTLSTWEYSSYFRTPEYPASLVYTYLEPVALYPCGLPLPEVPTELSPLFFAWHSPAGSCAPPEIPCAFHYVSVIESKPQPRRDVTGWSEHLEAYPRLPTPTCLVPGVASNREGFMSSRPIQCPRLRGVQGSWRTSLDGSRRHRK